MMDPIRRRGFAPFDRHVIDVLHRAIAKDPHKAADIIAPVIVGRATEQALVEGQNKPMSKITELSQRIHKHKAAMDADADAMMARLDEIEKRWPGVRDQGSGYLDEQKADIDTMEADMRQLSNGPTPGPLAKS